jgi:hypothetical protein
MGTGTSVTGVTDLSVRGLPRDEIGFFVSESAHRSRARSLHPGGRVVKRAVPGQPYSLDDGLGIRRVAHDGRTQTEILALAPVLANHPIVEQAIRTRASRYADLEMRSFAAVRRLERSGTSFNIVTEMPAGVRLSHLLTHLESTGEMVRDPAIFELASLIINAVASLHAWPGSLAHGAINPAHILLTNDGRVLLTDGVFGGGLEALQRNREALWKEFRLAMPPAASLARFDKQTDVTQMGASILALILRRPLRAPEYPRGVSDLVMTATEAESLSGSAAGLTLRTWLQATLQIHARVAFRSAVEAQRSFSELASTRHSRSEGAAALQLLVHTTCAAPSNQPASVLHAPAALSAFPERKAR